MSPWRNLIRRAARTSGQVIGLFGFDLDGQRNKRDWLRGTSLRLSCGLRPCPIEGQETLGAARRVS